jgi:anti-anti-sigma factor
MSAARQDTFRPFTVDVQPERDVVRVALRGDLDLATVSPVREQIDQLIANGFVRVLLDLREVTFLDSTGLRLVLELYHGSCADGWELAVIEGPPDVQRVFQLTGLRDLLPLVDATSNAAWSAVHRSS